MKYLWLVILVSLIGCKKEYAKTPKQEKQSSRSFLWSDKSHKLPLSVVFIGGQKELHKLVNTNIKAAQVYALHTCLDSSRKHLTNFKTWNHTDEIGYKADTWVRVYNNFTGEKLSNFYDIKDKCGCFFVRAEIDGKLWVDDFFGKCVN